MIDCESCPVQAQLAGLDRANADAWAKYRHLTGHRVVWDARAGNWWFGHVFRDVDPDDLDEVMARVRVLYDAFQPPRESS